jgi:hypothetical protein
LLEGKYNLANDNYQEVSQVQILENHQPIKTLDSLQFSDRTAQYQTPILLQVKREGSGLAHYFGMPILMLFSKKRQMLTPIKRIIRDNVASQLKS